MCEPIPACTMEVDENSANTARMATPSFGVVKSAYEKITASLKEIEKSEAFKKGSPNTMKMYQKLMQQKETFLEAIKEHPGYEKFKQERTEKKKANTNKTLEQLTDEERADFRWKWKRMASPKKAALLGALSTINRALCALKEDRFWCKSKSKKNLFKFLVIHRKRICRQLAEFPYVKQPSRECLRFKPCTQKIVKVWEIEYRKKYDKISRKLSFEHDASINRLGLPHVKFVDESINKYENFMYILNESMMAKLVETKEEREKRLEGLVQRFEECAKRRAFLINLKAEIEASKEQETAALMAKCEENYGPPKAKKEVEKEKEKKLENWEKKQTEYPPPGSWPEPSNPSKPFSRNLELPPKNKLEEILKFQQNRLHEIEKFDKIRGIPPTNDNKNEKEEEPIPSKAKTDNKSQSKSKKNDKGKKSKRAVMEEDENQGTPKESSSVAPRKNPIDVRKLKDGIANNINFLRGLIDNYPEPQFRHLCKPDVVKKCKNKEFNIQSEASNEAFAWPKWGILKYSFEKYNDLIKKFEADIANKEALKVFLEGANEDGDQMEEENVAKSPEEMEKELKAKDLKSRLKVYQRLQAARDRISKYINLREERWQQQLLPCDCEVTYHSHNNVCNRSEPKLKKRCPYPLTHPRKDMFIAKEPRMREALEKHLTWIDEKLKIDGKEQEEIERALGACEKEFVVGDENNKNNVDENEEDGVNEESVEGSQNEEDKKKRMSYIHRYVRHKFILERLIDSLVVQDDEDRNQVFHVKNHTKNANEEFLYFDFNKKRPVDLRHTASLALPKKIVLEATLNSFAALMSCEKQKRILCQLSKSREPTKPEDFEAKVRAPSDSSKKRNCHNLSKKLKLQVAKKLYEDIVKILKKKISKKMCSNGGRQPVTQPFREIEKTILMTLMIMNGMPRSNRETEMYKKFTSILSNFLIDALKRGAK